MVERYCIVEPPWGDVGFLLLADFVVRRSLPFFWQGRFTKKTSPAVVVRNNFVIDGSDGVVVVVVGAQCLVDVGVLCSCACESKALSWSHLNKNNCMPIPNTTSANTGSCRWLTGMLLPPNPSCQEH
jgi:hypothetical protein